MNQRIKYGAAAGLTSFALLASNFSVLPLAHAVGDCTVTEGENLTYTYANCTEQYKIAGVAPNGTNDWTWPTTVADGVVTVDPTGLTAGNTYKIEMYLDDSDMIPDYSGTFVAPETGVTADATTAGVYTYAYEYGDVTVKMKGSEAAEYTTLTADTDYSVDEGVNGNGTITVDTAELDPDTYTVQIYFGDNDTPSYEGDFTIEAPAYALVVTPTDDVFTDNVAVIDAYDEAEIEFDTTASVGEVTATVSVDGAAATAMTGEGGVYTFTADTAGTYVFTFTSEDENIAPVVYTVYVYDEAETMDYIDLSDTASYSGTVTTAYDHMTAVVFQYPFMGPADQDILEFDAETGEYTLTPTETGYYAIAIFNDFDGTDATSTLVEIVDLHFYSTTSQTIKDFMNQYKALEKRWAAATTMEEWEALEEEFIALEEDFFARFEIDLSESEFESIEDAFWTALWYGGEITTTGPIVTDATDEQIAEAKDAVLEVFNGINTGFANHISWYDVSIEVSVFDEYIGHLINPSTPATVTIEDMDDAPLGYTRTYQVVGYHCDADDNCSAKAVDSTYDADAKTVSFDSDEFSTYAVAYVDTPSTPDTGHLTMTNDGAKGVDGTTSALASMTVFGTILALAAAVKFAKKH